jgi:uncharacterized protein
MRREIRHQNNGLEQMRFDLSRDATYYTRPMSEASSKTLLVGPLADERADMLLSIPLADLPRVQPRLAATAGTISARVQFRREGALAVAAVAVSGAVPMICQRCLALMSWPVDGNALVAFIEAESQADVMPDYLEPVWAPQGRVSVRDLVEEELLLCLPIVALHPHRSGCTPPATRTSATSSADRSAVQRPFAQLGELLRRDTESNIASEETIRGRSKKS